MKIAVLFSALLLGVVACKSSNSNPEYSSRVAAVGLPTFEDFDLATDPNPDALDDTGCDLISLSACQKGGGGRACFEQYFCVAP